MQRRSFVKSSFVGASAVASGFIPYRNHNSEKVRMVYELRRYEMIRNYRQNDLDRYFKEALIPALNHRGVENVGGFVPSGKAEPAVVYLLIPYPSPMDFFRISGELNQDKAFLKASEFYDNQPADNPVFNRIKSSLMIAFENFPVLRKPDNDKRLFEIRTYEGYNEDAVRRKISMFNNGEIDIFLKNKFSPVLYSEVLIGDDLPCLTYMLAFRDMEERDRLWKDFGNDPDWKTMSADPKYANTVSRIIKIFLEPLPWSQI